MRERKDGVLNSLVCVIKKFNRILSFLHTMIVVQLLDQGSSESFLTANNILCDLDDQHHNNLVCTC